MVDKKYKIAYIDEDDDSLLHFQNVLHDFFHIIVFQPNQDTNLDELVQYLREQDLDGLIVDFELKEKQLVSFNGNELIDKIREKTPFFPLMILTSKDQMEILDMLEDNDILRDKNEIREKNDIELFAKRLSKKIEGYHDRIEKTKQLIDELVQKKINNEGTLSVEEEEELMEGYLFLDKVYYDQKLIPTQFIKKETLDTLNTLVQNTEQILKELKGNK